ncbi:hypothetical protein LWI29_027327 [Acer saccharum]|uniref:Retrotransposon Copia-like N-terminal domain-containing protein n=1 Tax=Acer saccharum TaxID=4024 RepID=A0AA39T5Y0_ACESA|nr:hypothetical protein LWI29_027327 [Acer saccharum]
MSSTSNMPVGSSSSLIPNITNSVYVRLDRTNYPLWLAQIVPLLRSKNLQKYVNGKVLVLLPLSKMILVKILPQLIPLIKNGFSMISLFSRGLMAHFLCLFLALLHVIILPVKYGCRWKNVLPLRINKELLSCALNWLLPEGSNVGPLYENTVASVQARETPITYSGLETLLLSAERRLNSLQQQQAPTESTVAMTASRGGQTGRGSRNYSRYNGGRGSFRGRGSNGGGSFPSNIRGSSSSASNNMVLLILEILLDLFPMVIVCNVKFVTEWDTQLLIAIIA